MLELFGFGRKVVSSSNLSGRDPWWFKHHHGQAQRNSYQSQGHDAVINVGRCNALSTFVTHGVLSCSRTFRNGSNASNESNARKTMQIGHWDMTWDTTSSSKVAMDSTLCNNRYNTNGVTVGEYVSVNTSANIGFFIFPCLFFYIRDI